MADIPLPAPPAGMNASNDPTYRSWLSKYKLSEAPDYDTYGAFQAGRIPDERGHLPDAHKRLNHITVSDEADAAKAKGAPPVGKWVGSDKKGWAFHAAPINVENAGGVEALQEYFRTHEPESKLILPKAKPVRKATGGKISMDDGNPAKRRALI
jgi:hypothetical protein